jgi:Cu(I)/Ag(I) efflux system periplasmic protein CusF
MKICTLMFSAFLAFALPLVAYADDAHHNKDTATIAALTEGEIRKVDKEAKKITIKHGPIKNLDMPAMTMVFQVKDTAMLDRVKAGDKVNFTADKVNGAYTVTQVETTK